MELGKIKMPAIPKKSELFGYLKLAAISVAAFAFARADIGTAAYPFAFALMCALKGAPETLAAWLGAAVSATFGAGGVGGVLVYAAALAVRSAFSAAFSDVHTDKADNQVSEKNKKLTDLSHLSFLYDEPVAVRACTAAGGAFVNGVIRAVAGGFLLYDVFTALFSAVLAAAFTLLFDGLYIRTETTERGMKSRFRYFKEGMLPDRYAGAVCAMMFTAVYSLRGSSLYIFDLSVFAAFTLCMLSARYAGALFGGRDGSHILWGAACGLCFGMACTSPTPLLGVAGIAAGAIYAASDTLSLTGRGRTKSPSNRCAADGGPILPSAAVLFSGALFTCLVITANGFINVGRILPSVALASAVSVILLRFGLPRAFFKPRTDIKTQELPDAERAVAESVNSLAAAYESLSHTFDDLAVHHRRPELFEVAGVVADAASSRCRSCPNSSMCHGKERSSTEDVFAKITASLFEKTTVSASVVPDYMASRCFHMPAILDESASAYAAIVNTRAMGDRTDVFALDYACTAKLLRDVSARAAKENAPDGERAHKLSRALSYIGLSAQAVAVWGNRQLHVAMYGLSLSGARVGADDLRTAVGNVVGAPLGDPCFSLDGESVNVSMCAAPRISIDYAALSEPKYGSAGNGNYHPADEDYPSSDTQPESIGFAEYVEMKNELREIFSAGRLAKNTNGGEPNGDTVFQFTTSDRRAFTLVCDGMGSGTTAALTSRVCALYLEKMLCAGASVTVALELLGGFLRSRNTECSAGVDLCEIDLLTSRATFIKSGAAPSFIVRDGEIFRLQSKTVPIGILRALDTECSTVDLHPGDVVVMLSDGVASSFEMDESAADNMWLLELLSGIGETDEPKDVAERIIAGANCDDDKSAAVMRIRGV